MHVPKDTLICRLVNCLDVWDILLDVTHSQAKGCVRLHDIAMH